MTRPLQKSPWRTRTLAAVGAMAVGLSMMSAATAGADETDPRIGLGAGLHDAEQAASNLALLSATPKQGDFAGSTAYSSDLAFTGDYAIQGNYFGFEIYDISDPAAPARTLSYVCPGGQGDVSVYGDLLFMSVESAPGRLDCGTASSTPTNDPQNFRGVRIFDISDIANPVQVQAVQTCRGSHTHTVVEDPDDAQNVYVYVSGTGGARTTSPNVPGGCTNVNGNTLESQLDADGNPILGSRFLVEVIKVPLNAPQNAAVVNKARLFTDAATGSPAGLWPGGTHGPGTQSTSATDACHDITAYPEIGLAAGACEGNGILIDISDPTNPKRVDAVIDPNFAYWHSATFNNDGTKVVFTDEWGGGSGARCREQDRMDWGANAIFDIVDGKLEFRSYYKLPVPQTAQENCVAHNGSLVPVPGRDIMVQAWYQGGTSVFDFTDSANPVEIAFFDRGPNSPTSLILGGYWSTYWYNGHAYGSEIQRGFDSLALTPSAFLSANEIEAASEVRFEQFNAQAQPRITHAPSFAVVRSYVDQAERSGDLSGKALTEVRKHVDQAEHVKGKGANGNAVKAQFDNAVKKSGLPAGSDVVKAIKALAAKS
ncbi:hypothetical protein GCM10009584_04380 [Ornithinimicrobium humiphilum]|uniref:LVIVD repeat-containing protein n=1 Tax=Ornithinimicrobium humiphilum TaxID=125288 RepID=A0A543K7U9_9MICO|nr:hypothetical protein [Ornithinimicrobium humiphilum]TQM91166.1 LVIVD repeat-containing protein [Ornithinimicrobium humiphilum]